MAYQTGDRLGQFEVLGPLGEGGMGVVYRAKDTRLGREVALKVLPAGYAQSPERVARFKREAEVLASLNHPNVGALYDLLEVDGMHVLVLELIEGDTLSERIARAPLPVDLALPLFVQIARALEAAHDRGIVHRDLKPSNIKIGRYGKATVIDFGIAKPTAPAFDSDADTVVGIATPSGMDTTAGVLLGTPAYMSPEHLRGLDLDERSDLWAFGCCLYQALSGQLPFPGGTATDVVAAVLREEPDWEVLPPDLPPEVFVVLRRCLEKDAARRLRSARDVALLLDYQADAAAEGIGEARNWIPVAKQPVLGRPNWILDERLGEGGFGEVWLATHQKTLAKRVFKFCRDPERVRGLKREVILFRLLKETLGDRKDIAQIVDWQFDRPPYYLESEYTQAGDLAQWAEERGGIAAVPLETRLDIVAQVAGAVAAAHSVGVLHKDIKPSNVLIANGGPPRAILTDFGIGYLTDRHLLAERGITATGLTDGMGSERSTSSGAGTRMYMAPELIEGKGATMQSDVYALGVLLYQSVAGGFTRALATGWERDIGDPLLREDIAACVDGNIEHRLQSASELHERLIRLEERRAARDRETRNREELERAKAAAEQARFRRRRLAAVAAGGLVLSAIVTLYAMRETQRAGLERSLRAQAQASVEVARQERDRAEQNLDLARRAVHDFFTAIDQSTMAYDPSYDPLRRRLIESSLTYHRQFVDAYSSDQSLHGDLAWTNFTMAAMLMQLEDPAWLDSYNAGLDLLDTILKTETKAEDLGRMAEGVWHAGSTGGPNALRSIQMNPEAAYKANERAIQITESLARKYPEVRGFRNDLGIDYHLMGHMVEHASQDKAMEMHLRALELWQGLLAEDDTSPDYLYGIALSLDRIGSLHDAAGRSAEALENLEQAKSTYLRLLAQSPEVHQFQETYTRVLNNLGGALVRAGRVQDGVAVYQDAAAHIQKLVVKYPGLASIRALAGETAFRRGRALQSAGDCNAALASFQEAAAYSADTLDRIADALAQGADGRCLDLDVQATLARLRGGA